MTGRRIRRGIAVLAVAGVVVGGYAAYAASGSAPDYRTAVATVGDVEQTLALSGTLEASGRADLEFGTDGTVAAVTVEAGDHVRAGQVLARLDRTSLTTAVRRARADLTAARAQLETDEAAQAETVSAVSSDSSTGQATQQPTQQPTQQASQPPTQQPTGQPSTDPDPVLAELAAQQQAVTEAQTAASAAIADAKSALAAQTTACEAAYSTPTDDPTATPTDPPTDPPTDDACATALTTVQTAQDAVATAQDALQAALTDLADTLTKAIQALGQASDEPTQQAQPTQDAPATKAPQAQTPATPQTKAQTPTVTVTAATLARDQASIDQAQAELVAAQQSLRAATVRAPHAGRVATVSATAGDRVSAGDAAITVIAPGTTTVEVDVTDTQVRELKTGQAVDVTPAGAASALAGTVTAIGAVPDTSSGSTTYPVTVTLARRNLNVPSGATATLAVVVGTASDVVTVPASAVRSGSVTVLDGDTTSTTRVTTGVVGTSRIEVTEGLDAGDRVVLADLTADLPSTGTDSAGNGAFGGGFGGGGGPQFPGGGPVRMRQ